MISKLAKKINLKAPITVTDNAWNKLKQISSNSTTNTFVFSAKGGGCNGFSYLLNKITETQSEEFAKYKYSPSCVKKNNLKIIIDPVVEIYLLDTKIDYICEDLENEIYDSKFIYIPNKDRASTCGCGVSFSPKFKE